VRSALDRLRGEQFTALFGRAPEAARPATVRRLLPWVLFAVGSVITALRTTPYSAGVMWAEDAAIFFAGALSVPQGVSSIVMPYAGYLHVVPRILAALFAPLPTEVTPFAYTYASAIVTAALAVFVYAAARRHFRAPVVPLLAWLQFVTLTIGYNEVANNLANLHWYLDVAAFWAVFTRFESRGLRVVSAVVVSGAVLSDPSAIVLVLVVAARVIVFGWRSERLTAVVAGVAGLAQGIAIVVAPMLGNLRFPSPTHPTPFELLDYAGVRMVLASILGASTVDGFGDLRLPVATWVMLVVAVLALVTVAVASVRLRWFALAAVTWSSVVFAASWYTTWGADATPVAFASRYDVMPILVFSVLWFAALDLLLERVRAVRRPAIAAAAISAAAVAVALYAPVVDGVLWDVRGTAPQFGDAVEDTVEVCETLPDAEAVGVAIAPDPFAWMTSCATVERLDD
jgi:hypothetical protein